MTNQAQQTVMARAYLDWQKHLIEEPLPTGPVAEIARQFNISTKDTWNAFKLFILRFSHYGRWGTNIRPLYSLAGADMGVSESTAQNLVSGARKLGWLVRVKKAGSRGPNGGGSTAVWQINDPRAIADDDDFDVIEGDDQGPVKAPGMPPVLVPMRSSNSDDPWRMPEDEPPF